MSPKQKKPISLLLFFTVLFSIIIINACHKIDYEKKSEDPGTTDGIIKKFFTLPVSANEKVKAIAKSIEHQNAQRNFIERLVKRVGYPHWDKVMIASKNGVNAKVSIDGDSSSIVYIPFSIPDSNNTAAVLAVGLNYFPSDTLYHMLYPSQYKQYSFDTTNTSGWNARTIFHLFTEFDYQMFGKTFIKITDGRILGRELEETIVIRREITPTEKLNSEERTESWGYVTVCTTYGFIPFWYVRMSANDKINDDDWREYYTVCNYFWVEDPSDPGPLSLPSGNGTGSSGGGGGGGTYSTQSGGHWETIPPCPEERMAARTGSQPLGCSYMGWQYFWVPDAGAYNPYIYDTIGISSALETAYPCLYAFLNDSLPNVNYLAQIAGASVFKDSAYMHLTFDTSTTYTSQGQAAARTDAGTVTVGSDGITQYHAVISFNGWYLRNGTKEYMITTIIHEAMHAIFGMRWKQYLKWLQFGPPNEIDSNWIKSHYPSQWYAITNQNRPLSELQEHEIMTTDYMDLFKDIVGNFWNPTASQAIKDSTIKAICWGGLHETTAWKNLPNHGIDTCYYRGIQTAAENSATGQYAPTGCTGYNYHYNNDCKLRSSCN